ncbi:MAG: PKD domain-containing protein, partial [Chlorobi bacterium]|nr:PKD domain-containing protein [Chlorobiota bacterium]
MGSNNKEKISCAIVDPITETINANCVTLKISPAHYPNATVSCDVTIDWGDGNTTTGTVTAPTNFTHCFSGCGTYNYTVVRDCGGSGCITNYRGTLEITIPLNINISDPTPCEGDTITLEAQVPPSSTYTPVPPLTYTWDFGDGTTGSGNPVQHAYSPAGTYTGTVRVVDATGCYGTQNFLVTVHPKPLTTLPDTLEKCFPDTVLIDLSVFSGLSPYSYQWTPPGNLSCTACEDPLAFPPSDIMYYVTVTDANGCQAIDSVFIDVHPQPELTALNDTICPNDTTSINVTLTSGTSPFQWAWQPPEGLSCTNCASPLVYPDTTTVYEIRVTDANGCWDTAYALVFVW